MFLYGLPSLDDFVDEIISPNHHHQCQLFHIFPVKHQTDFPNIHNVQFDVVVVTVSRVIYYIRVLIATVCQIDELFIFVSAHFSFSVSIGFLGGRSLPYVCIFESHCFISITSRDLQSQWWRGHVSGLSSARCTKNIVSLSPIFVLDGFRIFPLFRKARNQPSSPSVFLEYKYDQNSS